MIRLGNPIPLTAQYKFSSDVKLSINSFTGYDSFLNDLFESFKQRTINFLTIDNYSVTIRDQELGKYDPKYTMLISLSNNKYLQERKSGTILGWLSDIGGLNDAFVLILAPLITMISSTSFSLSITNDMPTNIRSR